ncbi:MAG: hypothetical protein J6C05_05960 [Prevotella sp.]|nr:hypothetical protein [Prevotella sp.]
MKKIFTLIAVAMMTVGGAMAQNKTYILDFNKMYDEASTQKGQLTGATQSGGSKYLLNDVDYVQDIFTVKSVSDRTYRIDLYNPDKPEETYNYGDYTAKTRLEPNGASNKTGGRQMFVDVTNKGVLSIGSWGNAARILYVLPAKDKTSYINPANATPLLKETFTNTSEKTKVYEVSLEPGLYCITQDAGIYYGYVKFVEGATLGISDITVADNANAPAYNLAGQRVNANAKGLVIKNGKKYMNK